MQFVAIYVFFTLVIVGIPIAISLGLAGVLAAWLSDFPLVMIPTRFFTSLDNFALLAAPFYILAGEFMNRGGITNTLIEFSAKITKGIRGGTAYANVLSSLLFAGISGTAIADTAALGQIFIKGMPKEGYKKTFAAAVTVASSMIGPIIPPSVIMIVYASVAQVSIIKLFLAGMIPGLILAVACFIVIYIYGLMGKLPDGKGIQFEKTKSNRTIIIESLLVFSIPVFIVAGTLSGAFTATEAGGIACLYSYILARFIFKSIKDKESFEALKAAIRTTSSLYLVIAGASVISYVLTLTGVFAEIQGFIEFFSDTPEYYLIFITVMLLIVGFFLEPGVQALLLVPVTLPISRMLGIDDMQFAMVFLLSGTLSLMTPPVGICLFVSCQIGDIPVLKMFKAILPFLIAEAFSIGLIIYFPVLSTYIPSMVN
ncbi:putative transporter [Vibrio nigripulchritudo SOn1]|uniref:TRAP transporter large permease protein n=1 Tax=Vibrio nigripulchritudo SOn1 TaxID=1238450 RepID=A0AAV2W1H4_9VIBR|nr:TRAP transporter large permease [Vibrio nigripulchritudo]CCO50203.1 putative transporter [Vibrio nigripulchritudo SOn1]